MHVDQEEWVKLTPAHTEWHRWYEDEVEAGS